MIASSPRAPTEGLTTQRSEQEFDPALDAAIAESAAASVTWGPRPVTSPACRYSHSMVPGGLLVTSNTTRLTSGTSLVIRVEMRSNTS